MPDLSYGVPVTEVAGGVMVASGVDVSDETVDVGDATGVRVAA